MARKENYYDVLSAAINDLIENGYDSAQRIEFWTRRLKEAAEDFLTPTSEMEKILRAALVQTYKRMTDAGGIVKMSPGVARWTIEKVRPALRGELDRRILASANLIKLNREQAIAKTLQRFSGWATSIPPGGTEQATRQEEKERIRKPLAQVKFESRRVVIDQSHKLTAALNNIVSVDNGAIAVIWNSQWKRPGYNYRIEHKERDKLVYGIRGSWVYEKGLAKKPDAGWYDEVTGFAVEPYCSCFGAYLFTLRDLEKYAPDAVTAKGIAALEDARAKIKAMA